VPPRPDGTLSFDLRAVKAITKQRNDPSSARWDDLSHLAARTLVIAGGPTATSRKTSSQLWPSGSLTRHI